MMKEVAMIKKIKKLIKIPTAISIIFVLGFLIYYSSCFYQNDLLIFEKDKSVILFGFLSTNLLIITVFLETVFSNNRLIKQISAYKTEIDKKNDKIEKLLDFIIKQNEDNSHDNLLAHKRTKELIIDIEERVQ